MRYRPLGQSGINASVIGLGTWAIGGWSWGGTDEQQSITAIQSAIDEGINLIDTAPVYGFGVSETIVGKAIKGRRDKVMLATKCGLVWDRKKGEFFFSDQDTSTGKAVEQTVHRYLGPDSIRAEVEASLKRLGTDRIDLLQTHWQDPTTPIARILPCVCKSSSAAMVSAIGVSNAKPEQIVEYRKHGPIASAQEKFSMLDRSKCPTIEAAKSAGMAVLAYSPLEYGLLTGKIGEDREFPEDDLRHDSPRFTRENRRKVIEMLEEFHHLAHTCGLTEGQLVLLWTISQLGVTHALVGARNPQQAKENAAAGHERLDQYDLAQMKEAMDKHLPGIK
jgi:methylglyoxal reductase